MKINKRNRVIYGIGLAISIVLVVLYFICPENPWCVVSCSVGASGIGAVILACFIEWSNEKTRAENRKNVRATKLSSPKFIATYLLESCVTCYFRKRDKLLSISRSEECHKITFDELWTEIQNQDRFIEHTQDTKLIKSIEGLDSALRRRCELSAKRIDEYLFEMKMFEAEGYFNNEEVKCLSFASQCISDAICIEESLDMESLKMAFDSLLGIEEFQSLKSATFYYKNRKTEYTYSEKSWLTEDDKKSAISSSQRMKQDTLSK